MLILLVFFIYLLFTSLLIIISVAFITLLERKILGLIQFRYGPNKVGLFGFIQPFSDALKLLSKSQFNLIYVSGFKYFLMPLSMFFIMLLLWSIIPSSCLINNFFNSGLIIICLMSLGVFPIMLGGWFSFSIYSMIGSIRCVAQMISYEVSLLMIMISFYYFLGNFMLIGFENFIFMVFMLPLLILLFFSCLMEMNRTPSDLIEGESELVSGFNTEFYGFNFSLIFLGEYGSIMFMSGFMVIMIMGINPFCLLGSFFTLMFIYLIIIIRGSLPRIRYDYLMYLCWSSIVSMSLGYLILVCGFYSILW